MGRDVTARGPDLGAVDHPGVAVARCSGERPGEVGASGGLGEQLHEDLVGTQDRREMTGLLVLGAAVEDRRAEHPDRDRGVTRRVVSGRLLEERSLVLDAEAQAAVLSREHEAGEAGIEQCGPAARARRRSRTLATWPSSAARGWPAIHPRRLAPGTARRLPCLAQHRPRLDQRAQALFVVLRRSVRRPDSRPPFVRRGAGRAPRSWRSRRGVVRTPPRDRSPPAPRMPWRRGRRVA